MTSDSILQLCAHFRGSYPGGIGTYERSTYFYLRKKCLPSPQLQPCPQLLHTSHLKLLRERQGKIWNLVAHFQHLFQTQSNFYPSFTSNLNYCPYLSLFTIHKKQTLIHLKKYPFYIKSLGFKRMLTILQPCEFLIN